MTVRSDPYSKDMVGEGLDLPLTCKRAAGGSSWAALLVAVNTKPRTLEELMRVIGLGTKPGTRAFDAIADAWRVYLDALESGADL